MKFYTIKLPASLKSTKAELTFLRVEVLQEYATPFALVRYALRGEEQATGMSIDLEKGAFVSHFERPELEEFAQKAAPQITTATIAYLSKHPRGSKKFEPNVELATPKMAL